ncbi:MAG: hypothetical protein WC889_13090 [Myxococcota bacterium]|jgi:hypothetical protein
MNKAIIIGAIIAVMLIAAGAWYFINTSETQQATPPPVPQPTAAQATPPATTPETPRQEEKQGRDAGDAVKQINVDDSPVDKVAAASYLEKELAAAEAEVGKYGQGTPQREKAVRRLNMLKMLRDKLKK